MTWGLLRRSGRRGAPLQNLRLGSKLAAKHRTCGILSAQTSRPRGSMRRALGVIRSAVMSWLVLSNTSLVYAQSGQVVGPPNLGDYSISTTGGITYFTHTVILEDLHWNEIRPVNRSGGKLS